MYKEELTLADWLRKQVSPKALGSQAHFDPFVDNNQTHGVIQHK